jgi:flagellar hook-associated protein 3 FlgL
MQRVSSDLMNDDMQFWLRLREREMANAETRMARQTRIGNLRDDPLGAARAARYDSVLARLERYEKNAIYAQDQYKVAEGYARQALEIGQRLREIAVQGANGVYAKEDMKYMAAEVDQLVSELASLANARGPDGTYLFSGDKSRTAPFRAVYGSAPGAAGEVLVGVQYLGSLEGPAAEVTEGSILPLSQPGSELFWAERQVVYASFDAREWRAVEDSAILVDGIRVQIKAGDNVYALAAKINDSGAAVKASIDPRSFSLALEATAPHQLRVEEAQDGVGRPGSGPMQRPLVELGLIAPTGLPPDNWAPSARVSGGSLFDVALRLRDSLNRGDVIDTGGAALAGMDAGLDSLSRGVAQLGARYERLATAQTRLNGEIPDMAKMRSEEADLDLAEAITDYRMLEYAHQASLGFAGRLFPQTLLDFLR